MFVLFWLVNGEKGGRSCVYFCVYLFHNVCLRFQTPAESRPASHGGHLTGTGEALMPEVKVLNQS